MALIGNQEEMKELDYIIKEIDSILERHAKLQSALKEVNDGIELCNLQISALEKRQIEIISKWAVALPVIPEEKHVVGFERSRQERTRDIRSKLFTLVLNGNTDRKTIGKEAGLSDPTVYALFNGKWIPRLGTLDKIERYLIHKQIKVQQQGLGVEQAHI